MSTGRKVRSDARLEKLSAEQRARLLVWLENENRGYAEVAGLIKAEFGVVVGKDAVAGYWQRQVLPRQCLKAVAATAEVAELPEGRCEETLLKLARTHVLCALSQSGPDLKLAKAMLALVHQTERTEFADKRVALEERRVAMKERAAESATPAGAFDEQREKAERERRLQYLLAMG